MVKASASPDSCRLDTGSDMRANLVRLGGDPAKDVRQVDDQSRAITDLVAADFAIG